MNFQERFEGRIIIDARKTDAMNAVREAEQNYLRAIHEAQKIGGAGWVINDVRSAAAMGARLIGGIQQAVWTLERIVLESKDKGEDVPDFAYHMFTDSIHRLIDEDGLSKSNFLRAVEERFSITDGMRKAWDEAN